LDLRRILRKLYRLPSVAVIGLLLGCVGQCDRRVVKITNAKIILVGKISQKASWFKTPETRE